MAEYYWGGYFRFLQVDFLQVGSRSYGHLDDALTALKAHELRLQIGYDENDCRLPLKASEIFEVGKVLSEMERPAAEKREYSGLITRHQIPAVAYSLQRG